MHKKWPDPVFCTSHYENAITDSSSFVKSSSALAGAHEATNSAGVRGPKELCGLRWLWWFLYSSTKTFASSRLANTSLFSSSSEKRLMNVSLSRRSPKEIPAHVEDLQPLLDGFGDELRARRACADEGRLAPWRNRDARAFTTSSAVIERSTSLLRHSLLYSSTTGIIFSLRPSSVSSITKS
jgi:hypothetical protein